MATKNQILNCPPLRFPEFNDEWQRTTLGEILKVQGGYAFKSDNYSTSGIPIIRISNLPICGRYVDLIDCVYYPTNFCIDNQFKTQKGELLIAMSGATTGKTAIYNNESCAYLNQRVGLFRVKSKGTFYPFLYVYVETEQFKSSLEKLLITGAQPNISSCDIEGLQAILPSLLEQQKIATFLSLLDERIEAQRQTIKERKNQKAGLRSLLIYRTDKQYVPLSYFGEMKHGYPFKSTNYDENGTYRIVTISNVSGGRYTDMGKCNCLIELPHDIQPHQILSHNDILISLTGNVGRVSFCLTDGDLLNQRVGVFSLFDEAYREYIYQVLSDRRFEISMVACGQGAAQLNISKSNVEEYLVPHEQHEDQTIADFLSLLDERIEVEEQLLRKYEEQKRYLLRKMFV